MTKIEELRGPLREATGWRLAGEASRDLRRRIVTSEGVTVAMCSSQDKASLLLDAVRALPALLDVAEAAERYIIAIDAEEGQAISLAQLKEKL